MWMYKVILEKDASVGTALKAAWNVGGKAMNLLGKLFMPLTVVSMGKDLIQGAPKEVSVKQDPDMLRGNLKFAELSPVTLTGSDGMVKMAFSFRGLYDKAKMGLKNFFGTSPSTKLPKAPGQLTRFTDIGLNKVEIDTTVEGGGTPAPGFKRLPAIVGRRNYGEVDIAEKLIGDKDKLPRYVKKILIKGERSGALVDLKKPTRYAKRLGKKGKGSTISMDNNSSSKQVDPRVKNLEDTLGKERAERTAKETEWAEKLKQTEATLGETQVAKETLEAQVKGFKNPTFGQSLKQTWAATPRWGKGVALAGAGVAAGALLMDKDKKEEKKEQSMFRLG